MKTTIGEVWSGPGPKPEEQIAKTVEEIRREFVTNLKPLLDAGTKSSGEGITKLLSELIQLSTDVEAKISEALDKESAVGNGLDESAKAAIRKLRTQLRAFANEIHLWGMTVANSAGTGAENARALFADAGSWAVHYSTVRMTVSTFLIGLTWGVVGLRWDHFGWPIFWAAAAVWGLAGVLLFYFSFKTNDSSKRQQLSKKLLHTANFPPAGHREQKLDPWYRSPVFFPCWVFLGTTIGFVAMLWFWACANTSEPHWWMPQYFERFEAVEQTPLEMTIHSGDGEIRFHVIDAERFSSQLDGLRAELRDLHERMPQDLPNPADAEPPASK